MAERLGFGRRAVVTVVVALGMAVVVGVVAGLLEFATRKIVGVSPLTVVHAGLALAAGAFLAALFGRSGALGWASAIAGGAIVTVVASIVASIVGPSPTFASAQAAFEALPTDLDELEPTSFSVPMALIASPFLGLLWLSLVSAVHAAAGGARQS